MKWLSKARLGLAGGALVVLGAGAALAGQAVDPTAAVKPADPAAPQTIDPTAAQAALDFPINIQIFGKLDPNIRKPTAIVNGVVITGTDVDQRVALVKLANQLPKLNPEEELQVRLNALRSLIDETLEIEEGKANKVTVGQSEIEKGFDRVAANFSKSPAEFRVILKNAGSSERSMKRQIEAELAWSRVLRREVDINVGDEEVQAILDRMKQSKGSEEYHLREVYLSATPDRTQQVFAQERQMIQEMQKGEKPFEYFAQFSEATTRRTGGDLGWLSASQLTQLPDSMVTAARSMKIGEISGPIEVPGGFSILYLVDKRRALEADPRDAKLTLKQISIRFAAGLSEADAKARVQAFADATGKIRGCGDVGNAATALGAEVVDNASITARDLPPALQDIVLKMQIGQSTPPFGSIKEGIRALVLCGRDDPKEGNLPTADQVRGQMEETRVNLRAQQMLRDLRRDAVVEYR
ncbi:MAG: peptidylprolyl isomerase [Pseudomonadota bacterium]|nr:peptidylprolyl isomerase [Pseudomonadota bacterium]